MATEPLIFLLYVLVGTLVLLRLRKIAITRKPKPVESRVIVLSDDEWAFQAQGMHYARTGTNEVTFDDMYNK